MATNSQLELESLLAKSAQTGISPSVAGALARLLPSIRRDSAGVFQAIQIDGSDKLTAAQVEAVAESIPIRY